MAANEDSPRQLALKAGERYYSTGKPCINGHLSARATASGECRECSKEKYRRAYRKRGGPSDRDRERAAAWAKDHPDRMAEMFRKSSAKPHHRERKRAQARANRAANRDAYNERSRRNYAKHADAIKAQRAGRRDERRAYLVNRMYGLSAEQYAAMFAAQEGACAVCRTPLDAGKKRPHVDHDHTTGVVRGILCTKCNAGIGMLRDDPALVRAAAAYLERNAGESALKLA